MTVVAAPRAAYIHVPFCRHRCGYCNFTVVAGRDELVDRYLDALQLECRALEVPRRVDTLYVGGGTPTHLSIGQLRRLGTLLDRWFIRSEDDEYTFEANPADLTRDKVDCLADMGVNRLSLGVQSFQAEKLRMLERDHSPRQAAGCCEMVRRRIANITLDMIFAVPGESLSQWQQDLQRACEQQVPHMSVYGMTFERGTMFWNRRRHGTLDEVDEQTQATMYEWTIDHLSAGGWQQYEVSNYARPGWRSRHNQVYWRGEEYFAIGAGASRYVAGVRETNHRSTTTYIQRMLQGRSPVAERECLDVVQKARERLVLGLRRMEGVSQQWFCEVTGISLDELAGADLRRLQSLGLLVEENDHWRLTRAGLMVSDSIWVELL
ncbi:MAG: radical SAM family heme chaperone HemW [Pirellulaceae bacterium]|nr:radical SAM family heme chaperone HemW [Planctomycetales bacterium]